MSLVVSNEYEVISKKCSVANFQLNTTFKSMMEIQLLNTDYSVLITQY